MTKTPRVRLLAMAVVLSVFLGIIAFPSIREGAGGSKANAFVAQNANKSSGQTGDKNAGRKPKVDCSKADDAALAAEVRERLSKRASLKDEKEINVDVKARVVTLTGMVKVKSHRLTAAAEAKKVACIKKVVNSVCGKCPESDPFCCDGVCQSTACPEKGKSSKPK